MAEDYKDESTLRRLYEEQRLTTYEVADECGCSQGTVRYWMDKFGIEPRGKSHEKVAREDLIAELQRVAGELGSPPTYHTVGEHGEYSGFPYQQEFGSWNDALKAAGLEVNRGELVTFSCENCGETREKSRHYIERNERHFCSRECKHDFSRTTVECDHCGTEFECRDSYAENGYANLCPDGCFREYFSETHSGENSPVWVERQKASCDHCGGELNRPEARINSRNFCDKECMRQWQRETDLNTGENSPRWNGGKIHYYGPNWLQQRRLAMERDGHRCADCGMSREKHHQVYGMDLHCHHRVPLQSFKEDDMVDYEHANKLSNLIIVCCDCHADRERNGV